MKIFSIKNEKLNFFNRPIYCESSAEALTYIQNVLMSDSDRALSGLKADLSLYELGEIDFTTGSITACSLVDSNGNTIIDPIKVCGLEEIFETIPADRLKPAITSSDLEACYEKISTLTETVSKLKTELESYENSKKKGRNK